MRPGAWVSRRRSSSPASAPRRRSTASAAMERTWWWAASPTPRRSKPARRGSGTPRRWPSMPSTRRRRSSVRARSGSSWRRRRRSWRRCWSPSAAAGCWGASPAGTAAGSDWSGWSRRLRPPSPARWRRADRSTPRWGASPWTASPRAGSASGPLPSSRRRWPRSSLVDRRRDPRRSAQALGAPPGGGRARWRRGVRRAPRSQGAASAGRANRDRGQRREHDRRGFRAQVARESDARSNPG